MSPAEALEAMWRVAGAAGQRTVMAVDWEQFIYLCPGGIVPALLEEVVGEIRQKEGDRQAVQLSELRRQLEAAPPGRRKELMLSHLRSQIAQVMGYDAAHKIDVRRGFFEMGMDSLMVVELRNRIQFSLGQSISSTVIFDHATTEALAEYLVSLLLPPETPGEGEGAEKAEDAVLAGDDTQIVKILDEMNALSEDELRRLLDN